MMIASLQINAQTNQRIGITSVADPDFPQWNYSNYLNDNTDSLVSPVWSLQYSYSTVIISLQYKSIISHLSLYDMDSVFTEKPAYLYAINNTDTTYIGKFTGEQYMSFVNFPISYPLAATKIAIRKFGNNIPQKIQVFGMPYTAGATVDNSPQRISVDAIIPSINTGMNYQPWLNDTVTSLVAGVWTPINMQTIDIKLKFASRCQVSKISLYDLEGMWEDPARIFLQKDTTLILAGLFNGYAYKSFIDYLVPEGLQADAIVIRKYGNNIPQKVQIFGRVLPIDPLVPLVVVPTLPADTIPASLTVKIPIDTSRWYTLTYAPGGIASLFDGVTNVKPNTISASFSPTYECIYPLNDGESVSISKIKMYDYQGIFSNGPAHLFAIKKNGQRVALGTFTGTRYMSWVGPYPDRNITDSTQYNLDSSVTDIQYLGIDCTRSDLPTEIEFYGTYTAPTPPPAAAPRLYADFNKTLGMNGFSWDFVWPTSNTNARIIAEDKYAAIKNFRGFRHYIDWKQLEGAEGMYYFNPCYAGGWSCDVTYERCKRDSIEVLACIQNIPDWMLNTYPASSRAADNAPLRYGFSRDSVQSYIEKGKVAFQFAARYGYNTGVPASLVKVSNIPRWTGDPVNVIKIGLGMVKYIECGNELDKWWRGSNGYMNAYQYATLLSAFYDGHKGSLGPGVGVKNADSAMQVVIGGLAGTDPSYVRGMIEWCRLNRGYKADGKINLCWDVINYHHYSRDTIAIPLRGMAPEIGTAVKVARSFINFSEKYNNGAPVWITEAGFDINQGSVQKAIPVGSKTALETQADWSLRTSLTYLREGISNLFFFELNDGNVNSTTKYASTGLTDSTFKRKPAMDYLYQTNKLLGGYHFNRSLGQTPVIDEYEHEGKIIYAVWVPDEKGTTLPCTLSFPNIDSVIVYKPVAGADDLAAETIGVVNGAVSLTATETPLFIQAKPTSPEQQYVFVNQLKQNAQKPGPAE